MNRTAHAVCASLLAALCATGCTVGDRSAPVMPHGIRLSDPPGDPLPLLEPDWTPAWWDEPVSAAFSATMLPDLLPLIVGGNPVRVGPGVLAEWMRDEGPAAARDHRAAPRHVPIASLPSAVATRGAAVAHLCSFYDYACDSHSGVLYVSLMATRPYQLASQPAVQVAGGAEGAGGGGAVEDAYATTIMPVVVSLLNRSVVGAAAETAVIAPGANTLVLTARPSTHAAVEPVIDLFNRRMAMVVNVQVAVFSIARDDNRGLTLKPEYSAERDGGDATVDAIIREAIESQTIDMTYAATDAARSFAVALNALFAVSDARVVFHTTLETRNNVPVSTRTTRTQSQVESITRVRQTTTAESETSIEVAFKDITTGWTITAHPTVAPNGAIAIRLSLVRDDLVAVVPYDFGDAARGNTFIVDKSQRDLALTLRDGQSRLVSAMATETTDVDSGLVSRSRRRAGTEFVVHVTASVREP